MLRTKVFAATLALVLSGAGALFFLGGASASSWHDYQGELHAGHAYGFQVPAGAQAFEVRFEGTGLASLSVFDPSGAKLGFYELSAALPAASVASPTAGRYVIYVYSLAEGALHLRVDAAAAPPLDLQTIALKRDDVKLGEFPAGKLDQALTSTLPIAPVFVTLLYEGSAQGLDADVASAKGSVVTIRGENGVAFSPGVWTSLNGERASTPINLDGLTYTTTLHAKAFEGTLILSALSLDLRAPPKPPTTPLPPPELPVAPPADAFGLPLGMAVAFTATAGELRLFDPSALKAEDEEADEHEHGWSSEYEYVYSAITLYAPDDSLLAVIELDSDAPAATIELPVDGEYVAYVRASESEIVFATLASGAPVDLRCLELATETFELGASSAGLFGEEGVFDLLHTPVAMELAFSEGDMGVLPWAFVENEKGQVVATQGFVLAGVAPAAWTGSYDDAANFASGTHTWRVDGLYEGTLVLTSTHFLRDVEMPMEIVADEETHEAHEHGGAPPPPPAPPAPPVPPPPPAPPVLPALPELPTLPGLPS